MRTALQLARNDTGDKPEVIGQKLRMASPVFITNRFFAEMEIPLCSK